MFSESESIRRLKQGVTQTLKLERKYYEHDLYLYPTSN